MTQKRRASMLASSSRKRWTRLRLCKVALGTPYTSLSAPWKTSQKSATRSSLRSWSLWIWSKWTVLARWRCMEAVQKALVSKCNCLMTLRVRRIQTLSTSHRSAASLRPMRISSDQLFRTLMWPNRGRLRTLGDFWMSSCLTRRKHTSMNWLRAVNSA